MKKLEIYTGIANWLSVVLMLVFLTEQFRPVVVFIVICTTITTTLYCVRKHYLKAFIWLFNTAAWTSLIVNNYVPLLQKFHR